MKLLAVIAILAVPASVSPASPPPPLTPKQIFKLAAASSVRIRRGGDEPGAGSGTIIASDHLGADVLTCQHVVRAEKIVLIDFDEEGKDVVTRVGFVVKADDKVDLALIHVGALTLPARPVATAEPEVFDELYVIGAPVMTMRQSAVERLNTKDAWNGKAWTLTGESIPGMSGSGILNDRGELTCVLEAMGRFGDDSYSQIVIAIPLKTVRAFLSPVVPK